VYVNIYVCVNYVCVCVGGCNYTCMHVCVCGTCENARVGTTQSWPWVTTQYTHQDLRAIITSENVRGKCEGVHLQDMEYLAYMTVLRMWLSISQFHATEHRKYTIHTTQKLSVSIAEVIPHVTLASHCDAVAPIT